MMNILGQKYKNIYSNAKFDQKKPMLTYTILFPVPSFLVFYMCSHGVQFQNNIEKESSASISDCEVLVQCSGQTGKPTFEGEV